MKIITYIIGIVIRFYIYVLKPAYVDFDECKFYDLPSHICIILIAFFIGITYIANLIEDCFYLLFTGEVKS